MEFIHYNVEDFVCEQSFQDYCLGSDEKAIVFWENWISANPSKRNETLEAKRIITILSAGQGNMKENLDHLKDGIIRFDMLKQIINTEKIEQPVIYRPSRTWKYISIAASLLLIAGAGWYLFSPVKTSTPDQVVSLQSNSVTSGNLHRKTIVLPDGSVVTLHKNSTIIYSSEFDKNDRDITLTGEAFFDVSKKPLPFIVHTASMNVEVLGTAFNVSAYPLFPVEASLFRGKIVVALNDRSQQRILLSPNEKFILSLNIEKTAIAKNRDYKVVPIAVDPADNKPTETAWLRNRLVIEDESLEAIAKKLQQWYGIQISFGDNQVKTYRYSGTFETENIMKALEALQLSYPFNFRVEDNMIIISK